MAFIMQGNWEWISDLVLRNVLLLLIMHLSIIFPALRVPGHSGDKAGI